MSTKYRKKIAFIFGTRPEAIKLAPVILKMSNITTIDVEVIVTGQHREMLNEILDIFCIKVNHNMELMEPDQHPAELSNAIISGLKNRFTINKPDFVLVQGDTTSSMAASLAAFYFKIPVLHIEAGLRTRDRYSPFPEEINRKLTTVLSSYHFAPTQRAKNNLIKENIPESEILITGNTVIDALHLILEKFNNSSAFDQIKKMRATLADKKIILVTGHRRESFGKEFENICQALKKLAERYNDIHIIYPVHLNPNVQKPVYRILSDIQNISLINPLGYLQFAYLMNESFIILTDSGGIQEEAPSLGKPVLVMRKKTERPEGIEAGTAKLVGTDPETIIHETEQLISNNTLYNKMSQIQNPYGDGHASDRICEFINQLKTD